MMTRRQALVLLLVWGVFLAWGLRLIEPVQPPKTLVRTVEWHEFFHSHLTGLIPQERRAWVSPLAVLPSGVAGEVAIARPFGSEGHTGEDWNLALGSGDLGSPVVSPLTGWVAMAFDFESVWGQVVSIIGWARVGGEDRLVEVFLAHLQRLEVEPGQVVEAGQRLGEMGDVGGLYAAHLHWEVRLVLGLGLGGGYAEELSAWRPPSAVLQENLNAESPPMPLRFLKEADWKRWGSD